MQTAIAIFSVVVLLAAFWQILLVCFPLFYSGESNWMSLWGGWHLALIITIIIFIPDFVPKDTETAKPVVSDAEKIHNSIGQLFLPLAISFALSRIHALLRA